jgi:hypothetical protein
MAFKLRSGNSPKFKMVGSSKPGAPKLFPGIDESKNKLTTTPVKPLNEKKTFGGDAKKLGSSIDDKRNADKAAKETEKLKNKQNANPDKPKNWWEEGYGQDTKAKTTDKYNSDGSLVTPEKNDFFSGLRPLQQALGLSKEQRAARKLKKADRLTKAKAAEASGTETYKQAKFVDKAERKQAKSEKKTARKKARSDKKLAKYRKKNG